jgi:hypothetical protein
MRKKTGPIVLERRDAAFAPPQLRPVTVSAGIFAAGLLAAALSGCQGKTRTEGTPVTAAAEPTALQVQEPKETQPLRIKAPEAMRPASVLAAPLSTTVVIRPGHPPHMAGGMRFSEIL